MNSLSVVIPSRTVSNLVPCISELKQHEPKARIIVVDDGLIFQSGEIEQFVRGSATVIPGIKEFIFSRNVNLGIRAAEDDDIVVLNDDALLKTPGGFSKLQLTAEYMPDFGVIASTTNNTGNRNQFPQNVGLREDHRMVCFIAVLIPWRTIKTVGLLDEEFTAYGFEDDSYCYRVRRAGLKIGIHDGCFVDHQSLPSTFRGDALSGGSLERGREIFINKWGAYPL